MKNCIDNKVILIGNPNTGKTTLFNTLTGSNEHVGNWHGVTVSVKTKPILNSGLLLCDLPGVYSLTAFSYEEKVAFNFLVKNKNSLVINILDANNLRQNLFLTLELLERGFKNIVLVVNMASEVANIEKVVNGLSGQLNIKIIPIDARSQKGIINLTKFLQEYERNNNIYNPKLNLQTDAKQPNSNLSCSHCAMCGIPGEVGCRLSALEGLDGKQNIAKEDKVTNKPGEAFLNQSSCFSANSKLNFNNVEGTREKEIKDSAKLRHVQINNILNKSYYQFKKTANSRFDKIIFNKFLSYLLIFVIFSIVFVLTFGPFGQGLSQGLSNALTFLINKIFNNISLNTNNWFISFVYNGLFNGVVLVFSFLPQIVLLFFSIGLLEDTGILSRFAFMFDGFLSKFDLTGKSLFSLLMGFGCTTSAIITTRNLDNETLRKRTALALPNFSCSAKLPIFACLCGAFWGVYSIFVIIGLYVLGVVIALAISKVSGKNLKNQQNFILEMPKLRFPKFNKILSDVFKNAKDFVFRVGSVILLMNIIVWFISNITTSFKFELNSHNSILNFLGSLISPIFAPLGFGLPSVCVALICGLIAKEMVVGALSLANGVTSIGALAFTLTNLTMPAHFNNGSAIAFLVFVLLYPSCMSAFSAMKNEFGFKFAFKSFVLQFIIAYICSFIAYSVLRSGWPLAKILSLIIISFALLLVIVLKFIKNKRLRAENEIIEKTSERKNTAYKVV